MTLTSRGGTAREEIRPGGAIAEGAAPRSATSDWIAESGELDDHGSWSASPASGARLREGVVGRARAGIDRERLGENPLGSRRVAVLKPQRAEIHIG